MPKNFIHIAFLLLFGSSFIFADGIFVGTEVGYHHFKTKENDNKVISDNGFIVAPKIGYQFDLTHRFYLSYQYQFQIQDKSTYVIEMAGIVLGNADEIYDFASHRILMGYDYTPQIVSNIRGVIGVFGGYSLGLLDVKNTLIEEIAPAIPSVLDGFSYGAKLGLLYVVDNWDFEFGGKVMQTHYKSKKLDLSFQYGGTTHHVEDASFKLEQLEMGAYVGVSYRF